MKPNPRALLPFVLLSAALSFLAASWRGMPFWQKFIIACALHGAAGVKAFEAGGYWQLVWLIGICLILIIPGIYLIGKLFGLWRNRK